MPVVPIQTTPRYTVEQTSDAFADPFIIRDNTVPEGRDGQYYDVDGIYQTFETEEEAQEYAVTLNSAEHIVKLAAKDAEREAEQKQDNSDLIGKELTVDNRRYLIESIGEISGDVSMRDITFQNNVGFSYQPSGENRLCPQALGAGRKRNTTRKRNHRKLPQSRQRQSPLLLLFPLTATITALPMTL